MSRCQAFAALIGAIAFCLPHSTATAGELDGMWRLKYVELMGRRITSDPEFRSVVVIAGNDWTASSKDRRTNFQARFTTNDQASPREIDLFSITENRLVSRGIFEVFGKTFKVCRSSGLVVPPRPKTFASDGRTGAMLFVYERSRPAGSPVR